MEEQVTQDKGLTGSETYSSRLCTERDGRLTEVSKVIKKSKLVYVRMQRAGATLEVGA
jgi:hypothetical protein